MRVVGRSSCSWERGPWLHHLRTCFRVILPCCPEIACTTSMGPITTSSLCFFSCDVAVNVCPFKFIRFFIVQYHEPPLSFCWFRLAFTHFNGYNASTRIWKNVWRLRIKSKQLTLYSYIPTSLAFTVCRKSFTHHWVGFLMIPMIGTSPGSPKKRPSQAWKFWPPKWLRRRRSCGKSIRNGKVGRFFQRVLTATEASSILFNLPHMFFACRCIVYGMIRINTEVCIQTYVLRPPGT